MTQWFVVNTKPRQEQVALDNLQRQGQDNIAPIRSTLGARGLMRFGSQTPLLDNSLIEWFKQQEQQQFEQPKTASDLFKPGVQVTILTGPFAGLQAVYKMPKSTDLALTDLDTGLPIQSEVSPERYNPRCSSGFAREKRGMVALASQTYGDGSAGIGSLV